MDYANMFANFRIPALVFALLLPLIAIACPQEGRFSQLEIPITPGANASAFPTVMSEKDDAIIGVESDCCKAVELHSHEKKGDVMRMRRVERVDLKAGQTTVFAPGSLHIMFIGLKKPLTDGQRVNVTFHFANSADETVTFTAHRLHDAADSPKHHH